MHSRTRIAVAAAAATALTATGTAAALASTTSAEHGSHAQTVSVSTKKPKPSPSSERQGHDALVAAIARELRLSAARVSVALAPLFAARSADPSSPVYAAAARSLGVSAQQLDSALVQAKQSLAETANPAPSPGSGKTAPSEQQGKDAMAAAVAGELHLSTARVSVALAPLFAAGSADPSSPVFAAAARSLGVSAQQLDAALVQAKQSAAGRS